MTAPEHKPDLDALERLKESATSLHVRDVEPYTLALYRNSPALIARCRRADEMEREIAERDATIAELREALLLTRCYVIYATDSGTFSPATIEEARRRLAMIERLVPADSTAARLAQDGETA